ncbi:DUF58 domain-containing protein [Mucilaginibacter phyllosphaerae]|uniref:DUF58 domain-containing protein n=1 Tax=Mucilaginibacter phyllosphaerae TaxID=1812349 RepID=A0A4Y8AH30_9SPHI|nr:DUF58 domain-containing protein [Mucilaginibacter phyllosphaerae]MBB3968860.1 uncharacterized protein (DUF58 family) [Mucilaginibacter phyllosphaerae]TEW67511.1 DUF58 domain-containing protein [Mucilaginibacter phyllosphaerae]
MTIKDLPLLAKTVIDGFMNGFNKSTVKGPGLEFSQYRSYQPGDDLRWLDWHMFARSDRYYIRESEVETSISVRFLVDASASMNHDDDGVKKIEYAKALTASLAYLANLQGDSVALNVFQDGGLFSLPSRPDPQHLQRLFHHLQQINPTGKFTKPIQYKELFAGTGRKELLVFVTDMYQANGEIDELLKSLSSLRHEIIVFHLIGQNEIDFDFKGYTTLQDLETGETIQVNTQRAKDAYQVRLKEHLAGIKSNLAAKGIVYQMVSIAQPLDEALRAFLVRRKKGAK